MNSDLWNALDIMKGFAWEQGRGSIAADLWRKTQKALTAGANAIKSQINSTEANNVIRPFARALDLWKNTTDEFNGAPKDVYAGIQSTLEKAFRSLNRVVAINQHTQTVGGKNQAWKTRYAKYGKKGRK